MAIRSRWSGACRTKRLRDFRVQRILGLLPRGRPRNDVHLVL